VEDEMKRLAIDWSVKPNAEDVKPVVIKYDRYLKNIGLRNSTIEAHTIRLRNFLEWAENSCPSIEKASEYRDIKIANGLARSSLNNLGFAVKHFYKMNGIDYSFPFIKPNDQIPYYFDEKDVLAIFDCASHHIKHMAMLQTLFYGCLRASELCNLDILDLNIQDSTLRIREGKGGKDGIIFMKYDVIQIIRKYLSARPPIETEALFITDFGTRWDRKALWRMFSYYKRKAGIYKPGGLHVFSRHTPATIMIAKGADIRIVQKILRHNDIKTTLRYAHVSDKTQREAYEKFLTI
jgi:integrase/recombinase XerD